MQTTKKKPNILLIVLGAVLASHFGYLVAGAWREGIEFNAFLERFEMVCAYPLKDYFNEYTFRMVGYALAAYAIGVVMYYTSQRNYISSCFVRSFCGGWDYRRDRGCGDRSNL